MKNKSVLSNDLNLSEKQFKCAKWVYFSLQEDYKEKIKRYGLDPRSVWLQICYYVTTLPEDSLVVYNYVKLQFLRFLDLGVVGDPNGKNVKDQMSESDFVSLGESNEGKDCKLRLGNQAVEEAKEEPLDFYKLLDAFEVPEDLKTPSCLTAKGLNWKTFFQLFNQNTRFCMESIVKALDIKTVYQRNQIAKAINEDFIPAFREAFPDYIEGEIGRYWFTDKRKEGENALEKQEESILRGFGFVLSRKNGLSSLTKSRLVQYLGGNKNVERVNLIEKAFESLEAKGLILSCLTKLGKEGFSLTESGKKYILEKYEGKYNI